MTTCKHCGSSEIEYDTARGDAVCTACGSVLEDNIIVSEVTFQEQASGASTLVGQFVSAEGSSSSKSALSGSGFHHGISRDSREVTLQHAKKRLTHLGNILKLNQHCIDTAFGFFKMALQLNLTRGHMLLDFSDVLQINVYSLGRAYLKLSTALHINPPAIDPCLYIHRFAHKLELGEKVHEVSMTALRLVARMKRDWIHHGRRPAGLCGAALLVASRIHNFSRSVREVSKVVKLSEGTIRKRLGDFKDTPSSRLTIDEFLKIDLEQEHDPPCYLETKKKLKQQVAGGESAESADLAKDGSEDEEVEEGSGFSGIKLNSVETIISKARTTEAFMNVPTAGLTDDLTSLATIGEQDDEGEEENGPEASVQDPEQGVRDTGELSLEGIDDEEIDQMLLTEEEVKIKSQLWFADNADYLKELEEKKMRQAALEAEKASKPKKKVVRKRRKDTYQTPASSAGEAIERMLVSKKISTKINYDVLRDLDKSLEEDIREVPNTMATGGNDMLETSLMLTSRLPSLATKRRGCGSLPITPPTKFKKSTTFSLPSDSAMSRAAEPLSCDGTEVEGDMGEGREVVEETGPIQYSDDEDDEGAEVDDLIYDDDPLLHSDYEDDY